MARRPHPLRLAADLNAAILDTGITLWWRLPILMAAAMSTRDTAELTRMVSEKGAAAAAGMIAAQDEAMRITMATLLGKQTPYAGTAIAAAALRPGLRTVKANARRLRRKR